MRVRLYKKSLDEARGDRFSKFNFNPIMDKIKTNLKNAIDSSTKEITADGNFDLNTLADGVVFPIYNKMKTFSDNTLNFKNAYDISYFKSYDNITKTLSDPVHYYIAKIQYPLEFKKNHIYPAYKKLVKEFPEEVQPKSFLTEGVIFIFVNPEEINKGENEDGWYSTRIYRDAHKNFYDVITIVLTEDVKTSTTKLYNIMYHEFTHLTQTRSGKDIYTDYIAPETEIKDSTLAELVKRLSYLYNPLEIGAREQSAYNELQHVNDSSYFTEKRRSYNIRVVFGSGFVIPPTGKYKDMAKDDFAEIAEKWCAENKFNQYMHKTFNIAMFTLFSKDMDYGRDYAKFLDDSFTEKIPRKVKLDYLDIIFPEKYVDPDKISDGTVIVKLLKKQFKLISKQFVRKYSEKWEEAKRAASSY